LLSTVNTKSGGSVSGSGPNPPDDVCKCYGDLPIFKMPFAIVWVRPAARSKRPIIHDR